MKKIFLAVSAIALLISSCIVKTVFYDVNPAYESHSFDKEIIAVAPFAGMWKVAGSDTIFTRETEADPYPEAIAREIGRKKKCLTVMQPAAVLRAVPDIESILFRNRFLYKKMNKDDSASVESLRTALGADYLLFFESIFFDQEQQMKANNSSTLKKTILVFQVWDLKNRQFMYRGEAKGDGEATAAGKYSRSSSISLQNTAYELTRSLPVCK